MHPEDRELAYSQFLELATNPGTAITFEQRIICADDPAKWIEATIYNRLDDPELNGIVSYFTDITARRQAEEGLRQAQALAEVASLPASTAQELDNLLGVVMGNVDLMWVNVPTPSRAQSVDRVQEAVHKAIQITRPYLGLEVHESLHLEAIDLAPCVESHREMLARLLPSDVALDFAATPGDTVVLIDKSELAQLLVNLVSRARDACSGSCAIGLSVSPQADSGAALGTARISVTDSGRSLTDAERACLMGSSVVPETDDPAAGFRLVVVSRIVRRAGGQLSIEERPGGGSVVTVDLPLFVGEAAAGDLDASRLDYGTEPVLVIEPDESMRNFVVRALTLLGYEVAEAADLAEARGVIGTLTDQPSLVIVAESSAGDRAFGIVAGLYPDESDRPPVLYSLLSQSDAELAHPGDAVIRKPFGLKRLADVVRHVIDAE